MIQVAGPSPTPGLPGRVSLNSSKSACLSCGHEDAFADDRVLGPVEHEDRGADGNVGKALVDDQRAGIFGQPDRIDVGRGDLLVLLHQLRPLGVVAAGNELVDGVDELLLERHQVELSALRRAMVVAGARAGSGKLRRVLHDRGTLGLVAHDHPVVAAGVAGRVELLAVQRVEDDADAELFHLADDAFGEALVGGVVGIGKQHDLEVLAALLVGGEVHEAVAVRILQPDLFEQRLGAVDVERIVDRRCAVVEAGRRRQAARVDGRERAP